MKKKLVYTLTVVIGTDVDDPQNIIDSLYIIYNNVDAKRINNVEVMEYDDFDDYRDKIEGTI